MSTLLIPTDNTLDNYREQVVLEGATYTFLFVWNYRGGYWSLSLSDAAGDAIVSGVAMRVGVNFLEYVSSSS